MRQGKGKGFQGLLRGSVIYIRNLVKHLTGIGSDNTYVVFVNREKCFPPGTIAMSPCCTLLRYILQRDWVLTGRGASSRIVRSSSVWEGLKILMRSYSSALSGLC